MKFKTKTRIAFLTLLLSIFAALTAIAAGCSPTNDEPVKDNEEPVALAVPAVTVNGDGLASWEAVEHASGYAYKIDGGDEQNTNGLSVSLLDGQSIAVKSKGDGEKYTDSAYSQPVTYNAPPVVEEYVDYTVTTEAGAEVTLTTNVKSYTAVAENGEFSITLLKTETVLSITAEKAGYFPAQAEIKENQTAYLLPLTGSVTSVTEGMQITGGSLEQLKCSYYSKNSSSAVISFTDVPEENTVLKFTLRTNGASAGKSAHGAAQDGTPLADAGKGLADGNQSLAFKIGSNKYIFNADGRFNANSSMASYIALYTALTQKTESVDFAIAFNARKVYFLAKPRGTDSYFLLGNGNDAPAATEIILGGNAGYAQNFAVENFAVEGGAKNFVDAALKQNGLQAVNSASRRNADGSFSCIAGNGSTNGRSGGYVVDKSQTYDLTQGTLTLETEIYTFGGAWQFHGFYIEDEAGDKHYNIGFTQDNRVWASWSNEDSYNGYPGRVGITNTSCAGTFGSYSAKGGWDNCNTAGVFKAKIKLVINGDIVDLFMDGKRIVRADIFELFNSNTTMGGNYTGADSTSRLPSKRVNVGVYMFGDGGRPFKALFDNFTAKFSKIGDAERVMGDSDWKSEIYNGGAALKNNFVLEGSIEIGKMASGGAAYFAVGNNSLGIAFAENGKLSIACEADETPCDLNLTDNDYFDNSSVIRLPFKMAVTDTYALLYIDGALRLVYSGVSSLDEFTFRARNADVGLYGMTALVGEGASEELAKLLEIAGRYSDGAAGFTKCETTFREKPVINIAADGTVTATGAEGVDLVYSVDGGEYKPYQRDIKLSEGQSITVKAVGNGETIGDGVATARYIAYTLVKNGEVFEVAEKDGKIKVSCNLGAYEEVFILVLPRAEDIAVWTEGGALYMTQTSADGNGLLSAELLFDVPDGGYCVFVITENGAYAVEVK